VVLLQNSIDLESGEQNEVIHLQLERGSVETVEGNGVPTSPLIRFVYIMIRSGRWFCRLRKGALSLAIGTQNLEIYQNETFRISCMKAEY
jgi:hypothetical protein